MSSGNNYLVPKTTITVSDTTNLGGPFQGYSAKHTINQFKDSNIVMTRRILTKSWNGAGAIGVDNGKSRIITPFRAINNLGDFLSRTNYVCGGSNQVNRTYPGRQGHIGSIISKCDGTGVQAGSGNGRFVPDSSDYTTFKKQSAINKNYNDIKFGGDEHNASYVPLMGVRQ